MLLALASVVLAACTPARPAIDAGGDLVVAVTGGTVDVRVGDTFVVRRPAEFEVWQVDYAAGVLSPLTPADRMRTPGAAGWRFKALGAGETALTLTAVPPVGAPAGGRMAPPATFRVTIRVH